MTMPNANKIGNIKFGVAVDLIPTYKNREPTTSI